MFRLFLIVCIASILLVGCEQGRSPNIVDMMTDIATDAATETEEAVEMPEPELPTIGFDVEFEAPTIPEDVEILPDDEVFYAENLRRTRVNLNDDGEPDINGERHTYEPFIFDDALSALTDEGVLSYIEWFEVNVAHYCETGSGVDIGDMFVYFTQRLQADKFASQIMDAGPWRVDRYVSILNNEKVYFLIVLRPNRSKFQDFCE